MKKDLVIIGGGPSGLAAAISAYNEGVKDILIIEREDRLGGILNQCIHNGFGLTRFKESLTGPEYSYRFIKEVIEKNIEYKLNATVINLELNGSEKVVTYISPIDGIQLIEAKAVILCMGCRERSKGALNIPGTRPSGIFSAGTCQKLVNIKGYMPGKNVVILGSGDIGLIMARRMTLEGANVKAVCEIMPYSSGLKRNISQCLDDFNIPLYLSHTITKIEGDDRVTGVVISRVDENKKPIPNTEMHFDCDTILFSVGLIPENELSKKVGVSLSNRTKGPIVYQNRETNIDGVFASGNVLQVHDLVDFVSEESELAGREAAKYIKNGGKSHDSVETIPGNCISYICPELIDKNIEGNVKLYFRVNKVLGKSKIVVKSNDKIVLQKEKKRLAPGEMEYVILPSSVIKELGNVTMEIENE